MEAEVYFSGKKVAPKEIEDWEKRHSVAMAKRLQKFYHIDVSPFFVRSIPETDVLTVRKKLVDYKMQLSNEEIRGKLKHVFQLTNTAEDLMATLGRHKRKSSVVEIVVKNVPANFDLKKFVDEIQALMTSTSAKDRRIGLAASPDHLLLEGRPHNSQEIVEITGGAPMEAHFINYYGVEAGINYPRDPEYPYQMVGISMMTNNTIAGDIRHQYKEEGTGFRAKLADEFPVFFTSSMIREHQFHLANEFLVWYKYLLDNWKQSPQQVKNRK
ncbi:hypothetical protein [Limosilactobacillus sp.]|jgi:hypothetical protein|uniref:hypothetical protein n=1 Tax=Limosilactobacillus sp. TaxID=2773925 RepID=UPI0025BD7254|nr:hypothetical protein [Limosilactobacillus sp.]MCH3922733.1 hypothetical protein [Limosilactobacillus sp.]MCH3927416.1 hypothetical protein [Limosilactobacillus sp.]